ncbi:hypothetical protein [Treponema phagedenis]|uniref:hypothetical protein n=2 Tax=Treponema phagedenis TaxID=162 RepID=UPI0001F6379F|nr:hypothetical protein [Treponema phagedenis]EFW36887.1 hypothetical protein HMPREF9554_02633 [Treponema phagedenis F0421]TYT76731.1 hypothetical protein FS559_14955 [Treponema phagedenis]TYT76807.1 hypothetical protein FS559_12910 [Treponema phagedenis]
MRAKYKVFIIFLQYGEKIWRYLGMTVRYQGVPLRAAFLLFLVTPHGGAGFPQLRLSPPTKIAAILAPQFCLAAGFEKHGGYCSNPSRGRCILRKTIVLKHDRL